MTRQLDLQNEMLRHLQKSEATQREVEAREDRAGQDASGHWPLQKKLLTEDWQYQQLVSKRNYHQTMVHLYSAALTAVSTAALVRNELPGWSPPAPRDAEPPDTRTRLL